MTQRVLILNRIAGHEPGEMPDLTPRLQKHVDSGNAILTGGDDARGLPEAETPEPAGELDGDLLPVHMHEDAPEAPAPTTRGMFGRKGDSEA